MDALALTKELVSFESTSVLSNVPVTDCAEDHLRSLDFQTERIEYQDQNGVTKACVIGREQEKGEQENENGRTGQVQLCSARGLLDARH